MKARILLAVCLLFPLFTGPGAPTIADVWRGRITHVERLGDDLKLELTS